MVDFADLRCLGGWLRHNGRYFEYDNGPTVPTEAIDLVRDLDARGIKFQRNGDRLRVYRDDGENVEYQPGERDAIVKWKAHILAIVELGQAPQP